MDAFFFGKEIQEYVKVDCFNVFSNEADLLRNTTKFWKMFWCLSRQNERR